MHKSQSLPHKQVMLWLFCSNIEIDASYAEADADKADANEAIEAKADKRDKANDANDANDANVADEAGIAKVNNVDNADEAIATNKVIAIIEAKVN